MPRSTVAVRMACRPRPVNTQVLKNGPPPPIGRFVPPAQIVVLQSFRIPRTRVLTQPFRGYPPAPPNPPIVGRYIRTTRNALHQSFRIPQGRILLQRFDDYQPPPAAPDPPTTGGYIWRRRRQRPTEGGDGEMTGLSVFD